MADETPPGNDGEESPFTEALGALGALGGAAANALGVGGDEDEESTASPLSGVSPAASDSEGEEEQDEEATASPVAAAAAKAPRKKRELAIPKNSAAWFKARRKFPDKFVFTPEGDLQIPEMRGQPASVIKLPWYREATLQEQETDRERLGLELVGKEAEFDELARQLKEAIDTWRDTGAVYDVLQLQLKMKKLDMERSMLRSPLRWIHTVRGLTTLDIQPGSGGIDKSLREKVALLRLRELSYESLVRQASGPPRKEGAGGPVAPAAETPAEEDEEESPSGDEEEAEEAFIFFYDPADEEHGLFSPDSMVEFVLNETKYTSIRQAYEVERVTALGRKDARPLLLRTRAPKQVFARAQLIKGEVENPKQLWLQVLKAVTAQQPRYQEALRSTGSDTLVYTHPADEVLGIGLPAEDPDAMDKRKWKGANLLGQAWMTVRDELPAEAEGADGAGGGAAAEMKGGGTAAPKPMFTSHGISEKEAQERRGVLMARYKRPGQ